MMILSRDEVKKIESGEYYLQAVKLETGEYEYSLMEGDEVLRREVAVIRDK
jgi:hypothetical protein